MLLPDYLKENPVKALRLAIAAGGRCENCSIAVPPAVLVIHVIGNPPECKDSSRDLQKELLVLCSSCHRSFCSGRVGESLQRELVRHRPRPARNLMREILGYRPPSYIPPGNFDPEAVFRELFNCGAPDLCLNGG
jgi:hypothetical protein